MRDLTMRRLQTCLAAILFLGLSACVTAHDSARADLIGPIEAVLSAATAAPRPVRGVFTMRVKATGRQDGNLYLNSEDDYRDQRNLTIAIRPAAIAQLATRYGEQPDGFLIGKRITVTGAARRAQISFIHDGQATGKYYFQTHVDVNNAAQLSIVDTLED